MTQISTTLCLTFSSQILDPTQKAAVQAAIATALAGYTYSTIWHTDPLDTGGMLPLADTPGATDVDVICPVCQCEFKLGAQPL